MNLDELQNRISYMREFDKLESKPASLYDPSEGMNEEQLHSFVRFLFEQLTSLKDTLNAVKEELAQSNKNNKESQTIMNALQKQIDTLTNQLEVANNHNRQLDSQNKKLMEELIILKNDHYNTSKSRKGSCKQKEGRGKNGGRQDFDGTEESLQENNSSSSNDKKHTDNAPATDSVQKPSEEEQSKTVYHGPKRTGAKYNKQVVGEPILLLDAYKMT